MHHRCGRGEPLDEVRVPYGAVYCRRLIRTPSRTFRDEPETSEKQDRSKALYGQGKSPLKGCSVVEASVTNPSSRRITAADPNSVDAYQHSSRMWWSYLTLVKRNAAQDHASAKSCHVLEELTKGHGPGIENSPVMNLAARNMPRFTVPHCSAPPRRQKKAARAMLPLRESLSATGPTASDPSSPPPWNSPFMAPVISLVLCSPGPS